MRMTDVNRIRNFLVAGNATFTIVSRRTGTRFTYNLGCKKSDREVMFLKVLCGPDKFKFAGCVREDHEGRLRYYHSDKAQIARTCDSVAAFDWFLVRLQSHWTNGPYNNSVHPMLEFWHEGKCGKCNRPLTVPDSIATGLGPDCAAMMGVQRKKAIA